MTDLTAAWPLFGLRLRVEAIELRLPTDEELAALAELAAQGVHAPDEMPFYVPWTRRGPPELQRRFMQHHWGARAGWEQDDWTLNLGIFRAGEPLGSQAIRAKGFAVRRTVDTGSWLGVRHQGRGVGTAMRTAVLALAFDGLGALEARTGAFEDNPASLRVTRKLGYRENGYAIHDREGRRVQELLFVMTVEDWRARLRPEVEVEGLDVCRGLFGAD
jgi:RimJ/RimL family protein N-acetyltransferase